MPDAGIRVRPVDIHDLPRLLAWRNHPDVRSFMLNAAEIRPEEHAAWFRSASVDPAVRLLIGEETGQALGFVQFKGIRAHEPTDWGFYAAPGSARGSGRKLCLAALEFAFHELRVHKVCGQVLARNVVSIRFHEFLGFSREGRLREQHWQDGQHHDIVCFGLLRQEWQHGKGD
jgi:UDP-4-amino-4,6-dideoxy-N-acetyl-beta-L-altrosamine N-acetyltransferase